MQNAYRLHLFEDQSGLRCYNKHRRERKEREIVSLYYILDILRIKRAGLSVLQYFVWLVPYPHSPQKNLEKTLLTRQHCYKFTVFLNLSFVL